LESTSVQFVLANPVVDRADFDYSLGGKCVSSGDG
jgi:hypothetical protein